MNTSERFLYLGAESAVAHRWEDEIETLKSGKSYVVRRTYCGRRVSVAASAKAPLLAGHRVCLRCQKIQDRKEAR